MNVIVWIAAGLVWAGLVALMLIVNHGGHTGPHPHPEAPGIGEDLDDEREHAAWL